MQYGGIVSLMSWLVALPKSVVSICVSKRQFYQNGVKNGSTFGVNNAVKILVF
jgi:hypothetical protein